MNIEQKKLQDRRLRASEYRYGCDRAAANTLPSSIVAAVYEEAFFEEGRKQDRLRVVVTVEVSQTRY